MLHELLRSMELLQAAMKTMTDKCINGMGTTGDGAQHAVDAVRQRDRLGRSTGL